MSEARRGILTLASGDRRYIDMAITLARSLERHSPRLPRAVVTDSHEPLLGSLYDQRIEIDHGFGGPFHQKLALDRYAPFEETLFIDGDSLVVGDVEWIFDLLKEAQFGVVGQQLRGGDWHGDIDRVLRSIGREELPKFNGGIYYLRRSTVVSEVFETARALADRYEEIGLRAWRGGINEEPVLAAALSVHGVRAVDDGGRAMRTPIGMRGWLHVDVLRGSCRFNKAGVEVRPAIVHFAGPFASERDPRGGFYLRERDRLERAARGEDARLPILTAARHGIACLVACAAINVTTARIEWEPRVRSALRRSRHRAALLGSGGS